MASTQREREEKFEIADEVDVPDLVTLLPTGGRLERDTVRLHSTYYDTADGALLRLRMTLRRREGDTDTGWHLKVPAGEARTEVHVPLDGADLPAELRELVAGAAGDAPLVTVATIVTERRRQRLLVADGALLLELADDRVAASRPDSPPTTWRELEVELGDAGSEKLLARAADLLRGAGASPAAAPSKLARALGRQAPERRAGALQRYIDQQVDALVAGDVALRRGENPVHATRVGTRRLRSTLRIFGACFDPAAATALDGELAWYAGLLGEVRDREVLRERFAAAVADLPAELVLGPVGEHLDTTLAAEQQAARDALLAEMSGERYRALLATLATWSAGPPLTETGQQGDPVLRRSAETATRKADTRLRQALRNGSDDEQLHRARKAAKRARYASELAAPVVGRKQATKAVKRYTRVQKVLGDQHDSVVAAEVLRRLAAEPAVGPCGFTFGVLHAREIAAAAAGRRTVAKLR